MKTYITLILVVFIAGCVFSQEKDKMATQTYAFRSADPHLDEPEDYPANLDAVIAAPKNHKILMENDKVRVLEVTLAPGEKEEVHHHQWPSVLYILDAGDFIDYDSDGKVIVDSRQIKPALKFPMTMWKEAQAPHSAENLSKTISIRLIRVEMKN